MNKFFDNSFKKVVLDEGGYANDKDDTGGETYLGISRVHNPDLKMWKVIDTIKSNTGTKDINNKLKVIPSIIDEVKKVYKQRYWDCIQLDQLNSEELAHQIFDMAVNSGTNMAIKLAQELVGLPKTGIYTNGLLVKLKAYGDASN